MPSMNIMIQFYSEYELQSCELFCEDSAFPCFFEDRTILKHSARSLKG